MDNTIFENTGMGCGGQLPNILYSPGTNQPGVGLSKYDTRLL